MEKIQEIGQVVIFWPLFPEQAHRWLLQRARHYKKDLDSEAAGWLLQQTGESLRLLDQELAKCSVYTGERPLIGLEDVQASFGYHKASSPFDWLQQRYAKKMILPYPPHWFPICWKKGKNPCGFSPSYPDPSAIG